MFLFQHYGKVNVQRHLYSFIQQIKFKMHQVGLEMRDASLKKTNENFLPS